MLLTKIEGILKEREEFKKLEELVTQLQAFIMFNKPGATAKFTDEDTLLIRELFGIKPGDLLPTHVLPANNL